MDIKIKKDKLLNKLAAQYGTKQSDSDALKVKKQTVMGNIGDFTKMPEKLFIVGPIGSTRVRKAKPNENKLHGTDGKQMIPNGN